jgi:hypothetical protein
MVRRRDGRGFVELPSLSLVLGVPANGLAAVLPSGSMATANP